MPMSTNVDELSIDTTRKEHDAAAPAAAANDDDDDDDDDQHPSVRTKIIKCKTNNQQVQMPSYNILTSNGSASTSLRSIDMPNEHASIKLHIRRVCSPSSTDPHSLNATTNLLSHPHSDDVAAVEPQLTSKIIPRQFFNSNEFPNSRCSTSIPRRLITTRRTSLVDMDSYHSSTSIYNLSRPTVNNHTNIYDENALKKPTETTKRKSLNDQHEKKRTRLTKQPNTTTSKSYRRTLTDAHAVSRFRDLQCARSNSFLISSQAEAHACSRPSTSIEHTS